MIQFIGSVAGALLIGFVSLVGTGRFAQEKSDRLEGWGQAVNPDRDAEFLLDGQKLFIGVPGPWHDLMHGRKMNAPRVLRDVNGDFIAQVRVGGKVRPAGKVTQAPTYPFNGAGLLLWKDADNYVRLERAAIIRDGTFLPYLLFEAVQKGEMADPNGLEIEDGPIFLRLELRGKSIHAGASSDERRWQYLEPLRSDFAGAVRVGVAAINNTDQTFTAEFDGFGVFQKSTESPR